MDNQLQELFSLPVGLELVTTISGMKLYSSENLKKAFLLAFEKEGRGKPVANDVKKLVDNGVVTPVYLSKGLLKFISHRIFGGANKTIQGFYHMEIQKIYILIDNNINIFGTGSSDFLISTTMHECMHLLAGTKNSAFLSIFMPILLDYYNEALKLIFNTDDIKPAAIKKILNFTVKFEAAKKKEINSALTNYYKLLETNIKPFSKMDEHLFRKMLTDYIVCLKLLVTDFNVFVRQARNYIPILSALNKAYYEAFGKRNTYTTAIQELIWPSEVACVYSEIFPNASVIKKAFKALA